MKLQAFNDVFMYKQTNKQTKKTFCAKNPSLLLLQLSIGALHSSDKTLSKENLYWKKSFKIGFQGQHIVPAQNRTVLLKSQGLQVSVFIVPRFIIAVLEFMYATLNIKL